jgi:hypothetical protein
MDVLQRAPEAIAMLPEEYEFEGHHFRFSNCWWADERGGFTAWLWAPPGEFHPRYGMEVELRSSTLEETRSQALVEAKKIAGAATIIRRHPEWAKQAEERDKELERRRTCNDENC